MASYVLTFFSLISDGLGSVFCMSKKRLLKKTYEVGSNGGISILVDFRPIGFKLLCCGSLWSG